MRFSIAIVLLTSLAFLTSSKAADKTTDEKTWGNLSATFRYDGEPPAQEHFRPDKDQGVFKNPIPKPWLIVDRETKGISNVVVWLYLAPKQKPPAIHASYKDQATEEVVTETRGGMIFPHITLLWTSQKLVIKNSDPVGHDRKMNLFRNTLGCDLLVPDATYSRQLAKAEAMPARMGCNIHPWESGYALVRDNPYMALSDREGKLLIKNLPAGKHTFVLWHELAGFISESKRNEKVEKIPNGRVTVDIKPGNNDLGEFWITPKERPFP
jgi:hypothetical protein